MARASSSSSSSKHARGLSISAASECRRRLLLLLLFSLLQRRRRFLTPPSSHSLSRQVSILPLHHPSRANPRARALAALQRGAQLPPVYIHLHNPASLPRTIGWHRFNTIHQAQESERGPRCREHRVITPQNSASARPSRFCRQSSHQCCFAASLDTNIPSLALHSVLFFIVAAHSWPTSLFRCAAFERESVRGELQLLASPFHLGSPVVIQRFSPSIPRLAIRHHSRV